MQPQSQQPRLKKHTIYMMAAVALIYDIISIFLPTITSPVAALHFWIWFRLKGIKFRKAKQVLTGATGFLLEFFPLTSWFTSWTFVVSYLAWSHRELPPGQNMGGAVVGSIGPKPADNPKQIDKAA